MYFLPLFLFLLTILGQSNVDVGMWLDDRRNRQRIFNVKSGYALEDNIIAVSQMDSPLDCTFYCIKEPRCQSYNLKASDARGKFRCELNNATQSTLSPSSLVIKEEYVYYEAEPETSPTVICSVVQTFNFTTLGASGRLGPSSLGNHYHHHRHQVTLINGIQQWTVPITGKYRIMAVGASGGYDVGVNSSHHRGFGAQMTGTFSLVQNEVLQILVGQEGGINTLNFTSGGGGGSFVARGNNPLIVAGGGGGSYHLRFREPAYCDAGKETSGRNGYGGMSFPGGTGGEGATTADSGKSGGGGGGFYSDGRSGLNFGGTYSNGGEGGKGFINGGTGGRSHKNSVPGGFGGGGGGTYGNTNGGAGGGGGYSGGASGDNSANSCGGGGGSYNTGTNQANHCCVNGKGHGYVYVWRFYCSP